MHALDDGRGDAIGSHHQGGQRAGEFERAMEG
jgi:peptide subunit release factor 1 (eRF1)